MKDNEAGKGANPPRSHSDRPTLLVVMADPPVRNTVATYLRRCGMEVTETANADEALRPSLKYEAVLTELNIPGPMDGFSLAQRIQQHRPEVPVVLSLSYRYLAHDTGKLRQHFPILRRRYDQATLRRRLDIAIRRSRRVASA